MSFPASGLETTYRNNLREVAKMLQTNHGDKFMVSWTLLSSIFPFLFMLSFPIYFLYIGNIFLLSEIDSGIKTKLLSYFSKLELSKLKSENFVMNNR